MMTIIIIDSNYRNGKVNEINNYDLKVMLIMTIMLMIMIIMITGTMLMMMIITFLSKTIF